MEEGTRRDTRRNLNFLKIELGNMTYLGKHLLLEFYDCPVPLLSDPQQIEEILKQSAEVMQATVVSSNFHHFSPLGVSGVVIIQESHLTIHTWPEYGYAAVDIFTCGEIQMEKGVIFLKNKLQAKKLERQEFQRGRLPRIEVLNEKNKGKLN